MAQKELKAESEEGVKEAKQEEVNKYRNYLTYVNVSILRFHDIL